MTRTILTDGTYAYMAFLVVLAAVKNLSPQARRSRSLRRRVGWYSAKGRS